MENIDAGEPIELVLPSLAGLIAHDPGNAAEHIALWTVARFGDGERTAVERLHAAHPGSHPAELEHLVIREFRRRVGTAGAIAGGPSIVLGLLPLVLVLVRTAQMLLRLSALNGRDPADPARAAEILVAQGVYPSVTEATARLQAIARNQPSGWRATRGSRIVLARHLLTLLGVVEPTRPGTSRLRSATADLVSTGFLVAGLLLPLIGIPLTAAWSEWYAWSLSRRWLADFAHAEAAPTRVVLRPAHPLADRSRWSWFAALSALSVAQLVVPTAVVVFGAHSAGTAVPITAIGWIAISLVGVWAWSRRLVRQRVARVDL